MLRQTFIICHPFVWISHNNSQKVKIIISWYVIPFEPWKIYFLTSPLTFPSFYVDVVFFFRLDPSGKIYSCDFLSCFSYFFYVCNGKWSEIQYIFDSRDLYCLLLNLSSAIYFYDMWPLSLWFEFFWKLKIQ